MWDPAALDPRTPVLVGVGTASGDLEAAELMARAARAAGEDCGVPALLARVDRVVVPRGTWSYPDPGRLVAAGVGAPGAQTVLADVGISQQTLINGLLRAISAGEVSVALLVGGEAKAREARAARAARAEGVTTAPGSGAVAVARAVSRAERPAGMATQTDQGDVSPDVHLRPTTELVAQPEIDARLWAPVEQYALIESALRAAESVSVAEHRREVAELLARFNAVAGANPEAAFPAPMGAAEIAAFGPANRPLAFPYGKWHASQWTVDQGAALLLCSAEVARTAGVPTDRWVFPLVGLESDHAVALTRRRHLHRWPAMAVLGAAAERHLGGAVAALPHQEVYSCFPSAVRVQQRELGLPRDGTPTVTGGMAFAGGPFNSFVLHATAEIARRIRTRGGRGLVTTVSGLLTKPGLAVWGAAPGDGPPLVADLTREVAAATEQVEVVSGYHGEARVAACTVTYQGLEPAELVAVLDTPDGRRVIARSTDPDLVVDATRVELVGRSFDVDGNSLLTTSAR
jgi:acetyl-CoA C-acetyltransferase